MVRTLVILDEFVCWNPDCESFMIPNSKTCDGNADCPLHRWSHGNTTDDESKYKCFDPESKLFFSIKSTSSLSTKIRLNIRDQNLQNPPAKRSENFDYL